MTDARDGDTAQWVGWHALQALWKGVGVARWLGFHVKGLCATPFEGSGTFHLARWTTVKRTGG